MGSEMCIRDRVITGAEEGNVCARSLSYSGAGLQLKPRCAVWIHEVIVPGPENDEDSGLGMPVAILPVHRLDDMHLQAPADLKR